MIENLTETIIAEPVGLTLVWQDDKLARIHLAWASRLVESGELTRHAVRLKTALERYVSGLDPDWPDLPYDFSSLTDFQCDVLDALRQVPRGAVITYGDLAEQVGSPHGAQAIGKTMATNPFPLLYPCHRVIGKGGSLIGFSADGGLELKEYLLKLEGAGKQREVAVQGKLF